MTSSWLATFANGVVGTNRPKLPNATGPKDRTSVQFFVPGKPIAQGSKRHVGNGRMIEQLKDLGPWRERIAIAAHNAMHGGNLLSGPITLTLWFAMPRPKSAPKRSTPPAIKRPDVDKLARAVLDAITGVMLVDDAQVVELHVIKEIAQIGETPGVHLTAEHTK